MIKVTNIDVAVDVANEGRDALVNWCAWASFKYQVYVAPDPYRDMPSGWPAVFVIGEPQRVAHALEDLWTLEDELVHEFMSDAVHVEIEPTS